MPYTAALRPAVDSRLPVVVSCSLRVGDPHLDIIVELEHALLTVSQSSDLPANQREPNGGLHERLLYAVLIMLRWPQMA